MIGEEELPEIKYCLPGATLYDRRVELVGIDTVQAADGCDVGTQYVTEGR